MTTSEHLTLANAFLLLLLLALLPTQGNDFDIFDWCPQNERHRSRAGGTAVGVAWRARAKACSE